MELPKLAFKREEFRAGAMDGPITVEMGQELMECSFTMADFNPGVMGQVGLPRPDGCSLTVRGVLQNKTAIPLPLLCDMRGSIHTTEQGTLKPGELTEPKYEAHLTYYRMQVGPTLVHEIDIPNMVRVVNGIDLFTAARIILAS